MGVAILLKVEREIPGIVNDEPITIPYGTELTGDVDFFASEGPWNIREYSNPSWLDIDFTFEWAGRRYQYQTTIYALFLWPPDGTQMIEKPAKFKSICGTLDAVNDWRDDWSYIRPDGVRHSNRLKYTSCHFDISPTPSVLFVQCRYYDQNSDIADYVTVYYPIDYAKLLLKNDNRLDYDFEGELEDIGIHEGEFVTLKLLGEC